jgi:hypothetical protein
VEERPPGGTVIKQDLRGRKEVWEERVAGMRIMKRNGEKLTLHVVGLG